MDITILIALSALALSASLNFIINKIFILRDIIDRVNKRSSHTEIATRSGGLSIFLTLFLMLSFLRQRQPSWKRGCAFEKIPASLGKACDSNQELAFSKIY